MRSFLALLLVLWAAPVAAQQYPPEAEPLVPPEIVLRAWGFYWEDDVPLPVAEGDPITIDVLVVLASGVSTSHCQTGPDQTQVTLNNSDLATVRFRAHCFATTYPSSAQITTDLPRLRDPADGYLDEVHAERNRVGADTVILITNGGGACGQAYRPASSTSAFAVVAASCTPGNFSFPHEWGHNIGLTHDQPNTTNATWGYEHGWCFGNGFKDVMVYPSPCGGQRVAHFSNPQVLYQGVPTGSAATADGARVVRERAALVAGFRTAVTKKKPARPTRARVEVS